MTIRAKGNGIVYRVWPTLGQRSDVVHFQVGFAIWPAKRGWLVTNFADAFSRLENPSDDIRAAKKATSGAEHLWSGLRAGGRWCPVAR